MKKYSLDANALLRYFLRDNALQVERIDNYLKEAKEEQISVFLSILVFVEAVYTLQKFYGTSREEIGRQLFDFASLPYLAIEKRDIVRDALLLYPKTTISFIDILLAVEAKYHGMELITFDKKLQKLVAESKN